MGTVKTPKPVKLFASIIYQGSHLLPDVKKIIENRLGNIEEETDSMPFHHTDYYSEEMGEGLNRIFILFEPLKPRDCLVEIKLITNSIEKDFSKEGKRLINIDPGYISLEQIVLATTKNYTHRIYLGNGIYADLTLIFKKGTYTHLEWTYPDYAENDTISMFNRWRENYKRMLT